MGNDGFARRRAEMALIGALAGASLYGLSDLLPRDAVGARAQFALYALTASFFTALMALIGPLTVARSAGFAAILAGVVTALVTWASLRHAAVGDFLDIPAAPLAALALGLLPLPLLIAAAGAGGWRDYPTLFMQSWGIAVRFAAASVFVGVVWLLLVLSGLVLALVGIEVIDRLMDLPWFLYVFTGTVFGLGLAVVAELSAVLSPVLVLRMLRLTVPVVLVVIAVFIAALPLRGLSAVFGTLSAGTTLLTMVAVAVGLVSVAVDATDAAASDSPLMQRAAQGLALIVGVPALLAAWAIWLRVGQYGWTPERIFAALIALVGLGYSGFYAAAVLRGAGWRARVRQANIVMVLVVITLCALVLTPILNPERIAARNQVARLIDGRTSPAAFDPAPLRRWGRAGDTALGRLRALASEPGHDGLAARLDDADRPLGTLAQAGLDADLRSILPLQPPGATAMRDRVLAFVAPEDRQRWLDACRKPLPTGGPGCVMILADFLPETPDPEVLVLSIDPAGYPLYSAYGVKNGELQGLSIWSTTGVLPDAAELTGLIAAAQHGAVAMGPADVNQLDLNDRGLLVLP